ncbi:HAD-IA family hydrolase [Flavobacteriaceae bacterium R38]|nr:HAD-IA family hydrolase [Flavobacteriaceae bacterium R38]
MIQNIIFDFGDIFIDLDKSATLKAMQEFGLHQVTDEMTEVNKKYEKGLISTPDFISYYKGKFPDASEKNLSDAWNAIILDFPEHRLDFIENLAKKNEFRLFLLSNTNELHIERVIERMNINRYNQFKNCFEKFYLSYEINLRKPDLEIYNHVIDQNNLSVENTLFIDDTKENTEAAAVLGMKTWNLIPGADDITQLFNNKILFN